MRKIEKIVVDGEIVLDTISNSDYEHGFRLGEECKITIHSGMTFVGTLSCISDGYLKIAVKNLGEAFLMYSLIESINEIEY